MAETITSPSQATSAAAAAAVAPDAELAAILDRHSRKEKLTEREYGRLGAWKAKLLSRQPGRPRNAPGLTSAPAPATTPSSGPTVAGPGPMVAPMQAPAVGVAVAPVDPELIRRTTAAILQTCDGIARTWIVSEARKAGADEVSARAFDQAAALQAGPKDLMVQTSPEVLAALGVNAGNYPVAAFLTGAGIWSGSLLLAVNKLRAMQDIKRKRDTLLAPPPADKPKPDAAAHGATSAN